MGKPEIDRIFEKIKENKNLDYDSYVFYNSNYKSRRNLYDMYIQSVGKRNEAKVVFSAIKYKDQYERFRQFAIDSEDLIATSAIKRDTVEKIRKDIFTESLSTLHEIMSESGVIKLLTDRHNKLCQSNGFDVLKVSDEQVEDEFDEGKNSRGKLIMLYIKNAFWLNKFVKTTRDIGIQALYNSNFEDQEIKDEYELDYLLYMSKAKYDILKRICRIQNSSSNEKRALGVCKEYEKQYKDTFDEIFPTAKNDIFKDFNSVLGTEAMIDDLYEMRNIFAHVLLLSQMIDTEYRNLNPGIKQWGINRDPNNPNIVLRLEPEGYMLPASFHLPTHVYADAIQAFGMNSYKFPMSDSLERFDTREQKVFSTNVLVKPTPEQAVQIKQEYKKASGDRKAFLKRVHEQIMGKPHSHEPPTMIEIEVEK